MRRSPNFVAALGLVSALGLLTACESWIGDSAPKPLPGKRISVLSPTQSLETDIAPGADIVLPKPENVAEWPQAGGYPAHAMYHLALPAALHRAWSADIGSGGSKRLAFLSQPVVAGGKVFAMDTESIVSSYSLKTGERLWRTPLAPEDAHGGTFAGGLASDEGKLFVTSGFAEVVSLDAEGKVLWRHSLPSPVRGAPTVRAGRVFVITVDNETLALSAEDGHLLWRHVGISEVATVLGGASPAVDGNTVLSPYSSGELFALRVENGTVEWSDTVSGVKRTDQVATLTDIRGLPVVDRGTVYAAGNSGILAAVDLRTGRRLWDKDIGSIQTPWIAGDYIYMISNVPDLTCFDAKTGRVRWGTPLPEWSDPEDKTGRIVWTGPILASDRLIIVSSEGEALSVSPYTGKLLSREELPDPVNIPPIVADETLIFVTNTGELVAYR